MSSSAATKVFALGLTGLALVVACSTDDGGGNPYTQGASGSGTTPTAGSGAGGSASTAGSNSTAGSGAGTPATAGSGGSPAGMAGSPAAGGMSGAGGAAGSGGGTMVDITKVWKSDGCANPMAPQGGKQTIMTSGTKDADCAAKLPNTGVQVCDENGQNCAPGAAGAQRCGDWGKPTSTWAMVKVDPSPFWNPKTPLPRDYWIFLPQNYDPAKPYPLVFEGPGCSGAGDNVYAYNNSANNTVIRVGISPPNRAVGHGTNPGQGCFDDKEGDDSVDWVLYENLYDKLNAEVCFDRNRVFSGGDSSGSWFSNEVGCKYAGDATRPIRGIMPNTGGLPSQAEWKPTCTGKPMSGIWIHEVGDTDNPFAGNKYAIGLAMVANGCQGNSYDENTTPVDPMMNGPAACEKIKGCPDLYPLFVCPLPGSNHQSHPDTVNPAVSTYLQLFQSGAFLTQ